MSDNLKPRETAEATKYRLAQAMEQCMRTQSVDSITVSQIAAQCGVARQTFYRHFLDKYDLINRYFGKLLARSFEHMGSGRTISEGLRLKFEYIRRERVFFTAAFRADGTNSLKEHDFNAILSFYTGLISDKTGVEPDADTRFMLELYCRGSIYMTVKWVLSGMCESPETVARRLVDTLPQNLNALFSDLGLL